MKTTITQCTAALILVLYILKTTDSAPLTAHIYSVGHARSDSNAADAISYRQASEDDSYEDSSEDDGEDDAEQAQQSLIEQQNQQNLEESQESSDEEGGENDAADDIRYRRRRRDAEEAQTPATTAVDTESSDKEQQAPSPTVQPSIAPETTSAPSLNRTSVLILIRDALKKVTTVLPTEQVATNALQYFQLFEHFLQQTIERVIDDYDEDDEETTTLKIDEASPEKEENVPSPEVNSDTNDKVMESVNEIKLESSQQTSTDTSSAKSPVDMIAT